MRKKNLLVLSLVAVSFLTVPKMFAADEDLTHLIVNNDFEYVAENVPHIWSTWKPKDAATNQGYTEFYGWTCDLDILGGTSQGINTDMENHHGTYGCWIGSSNVFPAFWEFSQTIEGLTAGSYKVQCLLSGTKKPTSQRLFANNNVQYFKSEADYELNQTAGEIATFAGYSDPAFDKTLSEMVVYTTIEEGQPLKIGIRTGGIKGDGTTAASANPAWGWFKVDYFRLTKLDNIPSGINDPEVKVGYFVNNGKLTVKGVDAYVVYNISGAKIAEVVGDAANMSVDLMKGIYIVRPQSSKAFKVVVK